MFRKSIHGGLVLLLAAGLGAPAFSQSGVAPLPANAKAGECYAKVIVPAAYDTKTEKVVKTEAAERIEIVPAKYEWAEEKVLIKEGYEKHTVVPATYKWVEEKVMVKPASTKITEVPAEYELVEEKVLVRPAQEVWKKGRGPIEKINHATGDIMCKVKEEAVYKVVKKKKLKTPATTKKVDIPAEYKTVRKQVIDRPSEVKKSQVPPQYNTVRVRKVVTPAQEKRIPVPAEYQTVTKKVKTGEASVEWRPVLCQTNMSTDLVRDLQQALQKAGFNPGPIDGVIGGQTMQAMGSFQRSKGLATGAVTLKTLESLNITVR